MTHTELSNFEAMEVFKDLGGLYLSEQEWLYWGRGLSVCTGKSTRILSTLQASSKFTTWRFPGTKQGICVLNNLSEFIFHEFHWFRLSALKTACSGEIPQLD